MNIETVPLVDLLSRLPQTEVSRKVQLNTYEKSLLKFKLACLVQLLAATSLKSFEICLKGALERLIGTELIRLQVPELPRLFKLLSSKRRHELPPTAAQLKRLGQLLERLQATLPPPEIYASRLAGLQEFFPLEEIDLQILALANFIESDRNFKTCAEEIFGRDIDDCQRSSVHDSATFYSIMTAQPLDLVISRLDRSKPLFKDSLLDDDLTLPSRIRNYLSTIGEFDLLTDYLKPCPPAEVDADDYPHLAVELQFVTQCLRQLGPNQNFHLLLIGPPGTGKTQFCRLLSQMVERPALQLVSCDDEREMRGHFFQATSIYTNSAANEKTMIIDDAEAILNGGDSRFGDTTKSRFNDFLDSGRGVYLWNVNHLEAVPDYIRRRFDYSIQFRPLDQEQRRCQWRRILSAKGLAQLFSEEELLQLSRRHLHQASLISKAADLCSRLPEEQQRDAFMKSLKASARLLNIKEPPRQAATVFNPAFLNCQGTLSPDELLARLPDISRRIEEGLFPGGGLNLLFSGKPGTGKTEFVRHLAKVTGLQLITLSGADLVDKYVGETEKTIRNAFANAAGGQHILFFDEADSIFGDRQNSQNTYESRWINEFLAAMEGFQGLFIAATNLKPRLDSALLRRFSLKLEFDFPLPAARLQIYRDILAPLCPMPTLSPALEDRLLAIPALSPGDFKSVFTARLLSPDNRHEELIAALEQECQGDRQRQKRGIGFAS